MIRTINNTKPFSDASLYTVSEVATTLRCAQSTVRRHINDGHLNANQPKPGMRILIAGAELNRVYMKTTSRNRRTFSARTRARKTK